MIFGEFCTSAWKVPPEALVLLRGNWCFADSVKCMESYAKYGNCIKSWNHEDFQFLQRNQIVVWDIFKNHEHSKSCTKQYK